MKRKETLAHKNQRIGRPSNGQAMVVLGLILAVFAVMAVGLFGFEVSRMELAREQLRAACDSASLAAAATLANSDNVSTSSAQTQAMNTALTTFQQNEIIGVSLSGATIATSSTAVPGANQGSLSFQFLDPHNNNQPVGLGDPRGKIIQVNGAFWVQPAFGQYLGLSSAPVRVSSLGGVPALDIALCFDVSASIDDQTPVTFVRRQWNPALAKVDYIVPPTRAGSPAGALAQGRIYDIVVPTPTGSSLDGLYPQNLSDANDTNKNSYPLHFSEKRGTGQALGLRGATDAGSPPGNFPPGVSGTGDQYTFTDMVVNIDGNLQFGGITSNGFDFPDIATVVEASRGNLETNALFTASKANTGLPATVQPKAGYQAEYQRLAAANIHPLGDAQSAAQQFLSVMNNNTDAHFCLVAFTSNAGTSANGTFRASKIDSNYAAGGTGNFPVPLIALNSAQTATNYSSAYNALTTTVAISGTNIGDAVNTAVTQLTRNSRPGAQKAIVLFTDGQPTSGGPLNNDPWINARRAAVAAKTAGIPVYCIGLAQNPAIVVGETSILNDTNADPNSGGIAAIAGNGGKFFLVTDVRNLRFTFENIARQLVQLVQ